MLDLIMKCEQCDLEYAGEPKRIVGGCREYVRMIFQLCPDWIARESLVANFRRGGNEVVVSAPVVDGVCLVPHEVIEAPGFTVWLVGIDVEGVRIVSDTVSFTVARSVSEPGEGSGTPAATVYELCLQAAEEAKAANFSHSWNGSVLTISSTSGTSSADLAGPQGPQGIQGIPGVAGPAGPAGPRGEDGKGVSILGSYGSANELHAAHPTGNAGDAYLVSGELYVWDGSTWANVGNIQGPQGVPGEQGVQGIQGERGPAGPAGPQGPQGERGERGEQGVGIPSGGAAGQVLSKTSNGTAWVDPPNGMPDNKITKYDSGNGVYGWLNAFGVVTLQLNADFASLTQWGTVTLCTLPAAFRPAGQAMQLGYQYTASGNVPVSYRVNTDGTVQVVPYASAGGGTFCTCFTYVTNA